jgi:hypothetical protein
MKQVSGDSTQANDDADRPGVPGFRTWRGVYVFVFGLFVLDVIVLAALSRWFA